MVTRHPGRSASCWKHAFGMTCRAGILNQVVLRGWVPDICLRKFRDDGWGGLA